jgi:hypothetical protein
MSLDEAAGLMPAKPLAPSLPRDVQQAIERARREARKAAQPSKR